MRAAVVEALGKIAVQNIDPPELLPGSLLLRVKACAVCGSDLRIVFKGDSRARFPMVIGHEMAAEVVEVGRGATGFAVGDRVVVAPGVSCGECYYCRQGWQNLCSDMISVGYFWPGSFAEYMVPPPRALTQGFVHKIPDSLSDNEACLSEPLACCLNGIERMDVREGDQVVIIGAGPIGLMLARLALWRCAAKVMIVQRSPRRLAEARRLIPAHAFISSLDEDPVKRVLEETNGRGADVVMVAAGSKEPQAMALQMVDRRGRVCFFGGLSHQDSITPLDTNLIHYKECIVTGASSSTGEQNEIALDLIASGQVSVSDLISHVFTLEQIEEALQVAASREGLRVVVVP